MNILYKHISKLQLQTHIQRVTDFQKFFISHTQVLREEVIPTF